MFYPGSFTISMPSDCEIQITRDFEAPRQLLFDAFTKPELVRRWLLGPPGWSMPVCEIDLRAGGAYRYVWRKSGVPDMGMGGVFQAVTPPERLVATERFDESWYPGDALNTTVFTEDDAIDLRITRLEADLHRVASLVVPHHAAFDQDIAHGEVAGVLAAVLLLAQQSFDGDAVVVVVEQTVADMDGTGTHNVDAVGADEPADAFEAPDRDLLALIELHRPRGGADDAESFNSEVGAAFKEQRTSVERLMEIALAPAH